MTIAPSASLRLCVSLFVWLSVPLGLSLFADFSECVYHGLSWSLIVSLCLSVPLCLRHSLFASPPFLMENYFIHRPHYLEAFPGVGCREENVAPCLIKPWPHCVTKDIHVQFKTVFNCSWTSLERATGYLTFSLTCQHQFSMVTYWHLYVIAWATKGET